MSIEVIPLQEPQEEQLAGQQLAMQLTGAKEEVKEEAKEETKEETKEKTKEDPQEEARDPPIVEVEIQEAKPKRKKAEPKTMGRPPGAKNKPKPPEVIEKIVERVIVDTQGADITELLTQWHRTNYVEKEDKKRRDYAALVQPLYKRR
jgi:hypothetical protein